MTTAVKTTEKFLAYDGDCPMCLATVGMLLRFHLVKPEQTRANYDLEDAELEAARRAGIRNQLVVFDPRSGETRPGSDGLLWIIGDNPRYRWLALLLGLPGIRQVVRFKYEAISYNRRIISPPRHQIVCDCEPEVTVGRRLTLIVPLVIAAASVVAGFGATVFHSWHLGDAAEGAVFSLIAGGCGWLIMAIAAFVLLRVMPALDYVGHLAVTMFAGALALLPAALLTLVVPREAAIAVDALAVLAGFALMFAMQRRRVGALKLKAAWLWAWTLAVVLGTAGCVLSHFRADIF
jgi:predicted DCC family thiol-disulfide oxidoreductase YuxK